MGLFLNQSTILPGQLDQVMGQLSERFLMWLLAISGAKLWAL